MASAIVCVNKYVHKLCAYDVAAKYDDTSKVYLLNKFIECLRKNYHNSKQPLYRFNFKVLLPKLGNRFTM